MPELAYINGNVTPIEEAKIPIEDRGYQFADAVYEVIASTNGRLFCLEEHLQRMQNGMRELNYPEVSMKDIRKAVSDLFLQSGFERAAVYLQISRGVAPRNHSYSAELSPQIVITVRPIKDLPAEMRAKGAAVITVEDVRWGRCDIKTVQLLSNSMAKQQAVDKGAFEAVLVTAEGIVREASVANVFIVKGDEIATHPRGPHILPGITRCEVMSICKQHAIPVVERQYTLDELLAADEVFLTGTTIEVLPVTMVDQKPIGSGKPGPMALKLQDLLVAVIRT
jgi:D-alanine transaminase